MSLVVLGIFMGVVVIVRVIVVVRMIIRVMLVIVVLVVLRFGGMMFLSGRVGVVGMLLSVIGLRRLRRIEACALDDPALDAIAMAAAAGVAVARTAAVAGGTVFALFFGLAMSALIGLDQRLT